jgi:hypothetical protein
MNERELEDLYVRLADRLTAAGADYPAVLSRLVLLMMNQIADPELLAGLIDEAAETSEAATP